MEINQKQSEEEMIEKTVNFEPNLDQGTIKRWKKQNVNSVIVGTNDKNVDKKKTFKSKPRYFDKIDGNLKPKPNKRRGDRGQDPQESEHKSTGRKFGKRNLSALSSTKKEDPFPGDAPIPKENIIKYSRGRIRDRHCRSKSGRLKIQENKRKVDFAKKLSARTDFLLQEESGYLEADAGEKTADISQYDIADSVDITSAQKHFELTLKQFGPYRMNYSRNGRHLLIGGAKGHVAAIDWQTKKLLCEMNVMETINDVKWLHQETMFAVAQKQWTYFYDNQGIELHCIKKLDRVLRIEFLPYHFLMATCSAKGYLCYLDVSVGKVVAGHTTKLGRLDVMCKNPSNAIINLGHPNGTVTLWSPNIKEPLVKMLCHGSGVRAVAVNKTGKYMATSGIDRKLKIWDLRTYKVLQTYAIPVGASSLAFSHQDMLAAGTGNIVKIFQDCCRNTARTPYMTHNLNTSIYGTEFCSFEDVLGVSHSNGFSSLLIPGSGEPNFDALEENPYETKGQRRNAEVKMLLDKIQPDMIHLDARMIQHIDQKKYISNIEERNELPFLKPEDIQFEPKNKQKGRNRSLKVQQRKKGVKEERKREVIKTFVKEKQKKAKAKTVSSKRGIEEQNVLSRFVHK